MSYPAKYYIGNSIKVKEIIRRRQIPSPCLIISSPPYFDLLDYEGKSNQIGQSDYESYLYDVTNVFQQCYDLSQPNSTFWLIIDTIKKKGEIIPLPFDIYRKLKSIYKNTWKLKEIIIWDKEKNLPWNSKGKFKNQFEYILFFTKGPEFSFNIDLIREINDLKKWWLTYPERYNPNGKAPSNIWRFITPIRGWGNGKQNHFCPIPFPLAEKIITVASDENDIIFDPFAGSGSVLALGEAMNRRAYGIDINMDYKKRFEKEVLKGAKQYWINRKLELDHNTNAIKNFKSTNIKLRKLKIASHIASYTNRIHSNPFIYIMINKPGQKFNLYIITSEINPITEIRDESLNALITQAKVLPNIVTISENQIPKHIKSHKLHRYYLEKFYSSNSQVNRDNILNSKSKYEFIYSNIDLRIK